MTMGWSENGKRRDERMKAARMKDVWPKQQPKRSAKVSEPTPGPVAAILVSPPPPSAPADLFTTKPMGAEPDQDQSFRIFQLVSEVYDRGARCYKKGYGDGTVAAYLQLPERWVAATRERSFGPAIAARTLDAEVLAEIEAKLASVEAVCQTASEMLDEFRGMRDNLRDLRTTVTEALGGFQRPAIGDLPGLSLRLGDICLIALSGGKELTAEEIAAEYTKKRGSVSSCLSALLKAGVVMECGRRTLPGDNPNVRHLVYRLTPKGMLVQ